MRVNAQDKEEHRLQDAPGRLHVSKRQVTAASGVEKRLVLSGGFLLSYADRPQFGAGTLIFLRITDKARSSFHFTELSQASCTCTCTCVPQYLVLRGIAGDISVRVLFHLRLHSRNCFSFIIGTFLFCPLQCQNDPTNHKNSCTI